MVYIEEGLWVSVPDMLRAVYAAASIALDGKLLIIGGGADVGSGVTLANVLEYDPEKDNWKQLPSLRTARYDCNVTVLEGDVVVMGGFGISQHDTACQQATDLHVISCVISSW